MVLEKYSEYLLRLDDEGERNLYRVPEHVFAPTTTKLDNKVHRILATFCAHFNANEWTLTKPQAVGLVNSLFGMGWTRQTIEKSFIPAYKRLCLRYNGVQLSDEINTQMKRVCKTQKYADPQIPSNPFTLMDCERIVKLSLEAEEPDYRLISLTLVTMFGGLRVGSASSLVLNDLTNCTRISTTEYILNIALRQMKGGKSHFISYRGCLEKNAESNLLDPVYWLEKFLCHAYGLSLGNISAWNLDPSQGSRTIWGWRADAMRLNFQRWTTRFGYPRLFFNFHSLRRGSLCNRIIHGEGDVGSGILVQSMISAWDPRSRARDRYLGENLKKLIVANDFGDRPIARELLTPSIFHGIKFPEMNTFGSEEPKNADARSLRRDCRELLERMRQYGYRFDYDRLHGIVDHFDDSDNGWL